MLKELAWELIPQSVDTDGDGQADLEELQSGDPPLVPQKELCDGLELLHSIKVALSEMEKV